MPKLVQSIADSDNIILTKENIVKNYSVEIPKTIQNFGQKKKSRVTATQRAPIAQAGKTPHSTPVTLYSQNRILSRIILLKFRKQYKISDKNRS